MSEEFKIRYRKNVQDFTRNCLLTFPILIAFILNLIRRSLQVELNAFTKILPSRPISKQTLSATRLKLMPEAFIELNKTLIREFYTDNEFKMFFNKRIIAIDGSTLQLPEGEKIVAKYGVCVNQVTSVPMARISYAYDVLNGLTLDAIIEPFDTAERIMAVQHVKNIDLSSPPERIQDLYIEDRGYPSVPLFFFYAHVKKDFLMRCNSSFINETNNMLKQGCRDKVITLSAKKLNSEQKKELRKFAPDMDLNAVIKLRVIIIALKTGENEILITTLCDQEQFTYDIFSDFYFMRWGAEENYKAHKIRMEIENFSGKSPTAIEQDFHATIFTCNMRTLLAIEAEEELRAQNPEKMLKYEYKINKNVSAAVLKNEIIEILLNSDSDLENFCDRLKTQMKRSMVPIRPGRNYARCKKRNQKYPMNNRRCM